MAEVHYQFWMWGLVPPGIYDGAQTSNNSKNIEIDGPVRGLSEVPSDRGSCVDEVRAEGSGDERTDHSLPRP